MMFREALNKVSCGLHKYAAYGSNRVKITPTGKIRVYFRGVYEHSIRAVEIDHIIKTGWSVSNDLLY